MREYLRSHNYLSLLAAIYLILILSIFHGCSSGVGDNSSGIQGHWETVTGTNPSDEKYYNFEIFKRDDSYSGLVKLSSPSGIQSGPLSISLSNGSYEMQGKFNDQAFNFIFKGNIKSNDGKEIFKGNIKQPDGSSYNVQLTKTIDDPCIINPLLNPNNNYELREIKQNGITPGNGPPVVFVHGMGGSADNWTDMITSLPHDFYSRHRVWLFQYKWENKIEYNGRMFCQMLKSYKIEEPILIGISMGGLVSRACIMAGCNVNKLVTLGTPNLGTELAKLNSVACWADQPSTYDMAPGSDFLNQLNNDSIDLASRSKYYLIAAKVGGRFLAFPPHWEWYRNDYSGVIKAGYFVLSYMGKENDGLVPVESALMEDGKTNHPLPVQMWIDHLQLINPSIAKDVLKFISGL